MNEIQNKCKADLHDEINKISHLISKVERLNESCEDNMKRLNAMMLELKGIISMVRPMAKKNDWYKDEIIIKDENGNPDIRFNIDYKISDALKNLE